MKWSGQHIYDLISRFRNDVYLEDISTGTIARGAHLGLDSNNKIVKAADGGGDLTGITAGTGLSGSSLTGPVPTLNVDASLTHVTSVGTIGTGVWNATRVHSDYLDTDTAHLSGTQTFSGAKTFSAATTTFTSATADSPLIKVLNTTDDDQAGQLIFEKLRDDDAVASGQNLGEIWFRGQDSAQNTQNYAYIIGEIDVSTSGQESGKLLLSVANHDGGFGGAGLILTGGSEDVEIDVTVGLGANSVVTIPGDIDLAGDIDVDGTLETDALTVGGVAFTPSTTKQFTYHMMVDDIDTTKIYVGLQEADAESATATNKNLPFVAPFAGKLLKVFIRGTTDLSGRTLTWRLETQPAGSNTAATPTVVGTQSGAGCTTQTMTTYDFTSSLDSGDNIIDAGDTVQLSVQSDGATANTKFYITCLWEWNLS